MSRADKWARAGRGYDNLQPDEIKRRHSRDSDRFKCLYLQYGGGQREYQLT